MDTVFYFFQQLVLVLLDVLEFALLVRAILSWIDPMGEWKISGFLCMLTEPIILPFRKLCARMHWFEGVPIDIPFLMTVLVLVLLQTVLAAL